MQLQHRFCVPIHFYFVFFLVLQLNFCKCGSKIRYKFKIENIVRKSETTKFLKECYFFSFASVDEDSPKFDKI